VRSVEPLVHDNVQVVTEGGKPRGAVLLGLSTKANDAAGLEARGVRLTTKPSMGLALALATGRPVAYLGGALDRSLSGGGTHFKVRAAGAVQEIVRGGSVEAEGPASSLGGYLIFMDCDGAARLIGKPGRVSRLDVRAGEGVNREELRERIQEELDAASTAPGGPGTPAKVRTPEAQQARVRDVLVGIEVGFYLCGAGALVVGMFLVYNALAVSVAERSHDIGILRSLGATRGQVRWLFLGEAALLGATGTALGTPLGLGFGKLLLGPMQRIVSDVFLPLPAQGLEADPVNLIAGAVAGLLTAVVAAWIPAAQAAAQEPADAVRRTPPSPGRGYRLAQVAASGGLIAAGLLAMAGKALLPARMGAYGGIVLILVGTLAATPLLAALAARLLSPLARRLLGLEGRLAADNLVRAPGRTGLVIGALAASVGLLVQTAGVIKSNEDAILGWLDHTVVADLIVTSGGPLTASGQNLPLDPDVGRQIEETIPGARTVLVRFHNPEWESHGKTTTILLASIEARNYYEVNRARGSPIPQLALFRQIAEEPGTALVSVNFAQIHAVAIGDTITLPGAHGPVSMKVVGAIDDYSWNRGTVFVDQVQYRDSLDLKLADLFHVYLPPGDVEEQRRVLVQKPWASEAGVFAMTRGELREQIAGMVRTLYGMAYRQLGLIGVVTALGVLSALLISVLQRRRELGLLRAVGASRAHVMRSVLAEALLMGVVGTLVGVLVGIPLQWYVVRVLLFEEAGFAFPVRVPWIAAGIIALLALGITILAGLGPALHAMRLRIAEAIAYE
jgi:putative ABC transport system permease protein